MIAASALDEESVGTDCQCFHILLDLRQEPVPVVGEELCQCLLEQIATQNGQLHLPGLPLRIEAARLLKSIRQR